MRQLIVQVPRGTGDEVLAIAEACKAVNVARMEGNNQQKPLDVVIAHVSNGRVEGFISRLQELPDTHITLVPKGVLALHPPASETPEQVTDVENLSPIEVFLAGLQSVGSWSGFLGYAVVGAIVVWIGLFTNSVFLLIAAMLLAPFGGPAMTVAIGTARADPHLLRRGLLRYGIALLVTSGVAALLSLLLRQRAATTMMVSVSQISEVAVLLPLAAGAAGALNLIQSERSSLVPGAATGVLVAAALAPPAGVAGMAAALGEWRMAGSGLFTVAMQLFAINLAGALLFRVHGGISVEDSRYQRGKTWVFPVGVVVSAAALAALLVGQFYTSPELQRSSQARYAAAAIQQVVQGSELGRLVEVNARFTHAQPDEQNTLLGVVYVERPPGSELSADQIQETMRLAIQAQLQEDFENMIPLITVEVLEPPGVP